MDSEPEQSIINSSSKIASVESITESIESSSAYKISSVRGSILPFSPNHIYSALITVVATS